MLKLLPLLMQTLTLPQAVEQTAYTTGRCLTHLTTEARAKAYRLQDGNGKLQALFNKGVADAKLKPPTKAQCDTALKTLQQQLERHFP